MRLPVKIIRPEMGDQDRLWLSDPKEYREVKFFDGDRYPFDINIDIYADCVSVYSPKSPVSGLLIQNKDVANSFKSLYNLLWNFL